MDSAAIRRWYAGHRVAAARALATSRDDGPLPAAVAFDQAMELRELIDPGPVDAVREREVDSTRRLWRKLKQRWAAPRNDD